MKINYKKLIFYIVITFLIGSLFSIFIVEKNTFKTLEKGVDVPAIVFPIVWSILYTIMGISSYMISESNDINRKKAIIIYYINLCFNSLWTLIFFGFELYIFAFIWILLLTLVVIYMIVEFYKIKKITGIMNIPYLIWLIFAAYLNYTIIILN